TFIAGAGMSVLRATLMILAFMAALLISKSRDLYNTLAKAALIILIVYPPALFDVSFQLSSAAVLAILFITPVLTALIPKPQPATGSPYILPALCSKGLYAFALFIIVSLSAMVGTMPLSPSSPSLPISLLSLFLSFWPYPFPWPRSFSCPFHQS
ncbi:MAG: competence protein ComEC, partial [Thermodesulfobacteriota bacterium]|nr:competence protein ComEC [Thermodesulfobacteriota bacterium]